MNEQRQTPAVEPERAGRARQFGADALLLVAGLGFGALAVTAVGWLRTDSQALASYEPDARVVELAPPSDVAPGAASPEGAIESFLTAEREGNHVESLALLSSSDRSRIRTEAAWARARSSAVGQVVDFSIGSVEIDPGGTTATAVTDVSLQPRLDVIGGLVPPAATVRWHLVEEDGWRIDLAGSIRTDHLVADDSAGVTAAEWLSTGSCDPVTAVGPDALFRASDPDLTAALCRTWGSPSGSTGSSTTGPPKQAAPDVSVIDLAPADAAALTAAFGPGVLEWARVATVGGPVPAELVLAPVGDRWVVIDAVSP